MHRLSLFLFIFFLIFSTGANSQINPLVTKDSIVQERWVDSIMSTMSLEEKIGQLFMVAAYTNRDAEHEKYISSLIEKYHLGALIFFQDQAVKQVELTNHYQSLSRIPLSLIHI